MGRQGSGQAGHATWTIAGAGTGTAVGARVRTTAPLLPLLLSLACSEGMLRAEDGPGATDGGSTGDAAPRTVDGGASGEGGPYATDASVADSASRGTRDASPDASGPLPDASAGDAAPTDSSSPPVDAAVADGGAPPDSATPPSDSGSPSGDSGIPSPIGEPPTCPPPSTGVHEWHYVTPDPAGYSYAFARAHFSAALGLIFTFFGNSHNPIGNNSIRGYDPCENTWEYFWPNESHPSEGLQNRDNFHSLIVPTLGAAGELWVWGGSGLESYPSRTGGVAAYRSGRFDLATRQWIAKSTGEVGAFSEVVTGMGGVGTNGAMAWCDAADMGVLFGGSLEGNPINNQRIIQADPGGPRPYKMIAFEGTRPPPRTQVTSAAACSDDAFYIYGGRAFDYSAGEYIQRNDLWRFDLASRTWEELPSGGHPTYQQSLTYDSALNALVTYGGGGANIWAYFLDEGAWRNVTPEGAAANFNHSAVYAPTAGRHFFFGGNRVDDGSASYLNASFHMDCP